VSSLSKEKKSFRSLGKGLLAKGYFLLSPLLEARGTLMCKGEICVVVVWVVVVITVVCAALEEIGRVDRSYRSRT
jgi:hypothetical protein